MITIGRTISFLIIPKYFKYLIQFLQGNKVPRYKPPGMYTGQTCHFYTIQFRVGFKSSAANKDEPQNKIG